VLEEDREKKKHEKELDMLLVKIARAANSERHTQLYFDYHHITNEIILFGLKKQGGQFSSPLSALLFTTLFKNKLFISAMAISKGSPLPRGAATYFDLWINRLAGMLNYFPEKRDDLASLRSLCQELKNWTRNEKESKR